MRSVTLKEIEWLHDCVLLGMSFDTSANGERLVTIRIRCPADLGYSLWDGKTLLLMATDVAFSRHVVWGYVAGPEVVDAIRPGVSDAVQESTIEARLRGAHFPKTEFTMTFVSGSVLEIICDSLQIDV
jgi:hypothetical protein